MDIHGQIRENIFDIIFAFFESPPFSDDCSIRGSDDFSSFNPPLYRQAGQNREADAIFSIAVVEIHSRLQEVWRYNFQ